jgi:hypothetical protein
LLQPSQNHFLWLWIPSSMLTHRPGMTLRVNSNSH